MRSLKLIAIFSFCFCLLESLTLAPAFAAQQFDNVAKGQITKMRIGFHFSTNSGLYPVGCIGQKTGKLTISAATLPENATDAQIAAAKDDAADFQISDDHMSGQTCGRDADLFAEITFTPHRVGLEKAQLSITVDGDPSRFKPYFHDIVTEIQGYGVAATPKPKPKPKPATEPTRVFFYIAYLNNEHDNSGKPLPKYQSFSDAAATWEREIKAQYSFAPGQDKFIETHVRSANDFVTAWKDIYQSTSQSSFIVVSGAIFSHSSLPASIHKPYIILETGLEFAGEPGGVTTGNTLSKSMIDTLPKLQWIDSGKLILFGCNTAVTRWGWSPAEEFAKTQSVLTTGEIAYSYFSANEDAFVPITTNSTDVYLGSYWAGRNLILYPTIITHGTMGARMPEKTFSP